MTWSPWTTTACLAAVVGLGVHLHPALGVVVTVGDSDVVFDSGGFEDEQVGNEPTSPSVGSYTDPATPGVSVLTGPATSGAAVAGPTGAYSGEQYLTIDRTSDGANANTRIAGLFDRNINTATESFSLEFAYWGDANSNGAFAVSTADFDGVVASGASGASQLVAFGFRTVSGTAEVYEFRSTGTVGIAGLSWNHGAWNTVRFDWNASTQEGFLSVNGSIPAAVVTTNGTTIPAQVGRLNMRANSGQTEYVDAIPEPASLGLLGAGVMLLARRRSR